MKNLIIIYKNPFKYHDYYQKSFKKLVDNNINIFIFDMIEENIDIEKGVKKYFYKSKNELIEKIKKINGENFIHTFEEQSILLVNQIKKSLGQNYTTYYKAFTNKDLQREKLLQYDKSITVNYQIIKDFSKINLKIEFPIVIKPTNGAQSRGVKIIKNKEELNNYLEEYKNILKRIGENGYKNENFLIEEFIDGSAWSLDYFVDEKGNLYLTKPIFLEFGIDFGIDDFCNISRVVSEDKENKLDLKKLKEFIEKNIKALGIRNTFVHHEFKFTSKGLFKTIEINGRIGGFRLQMYDICYNINLFDIAFGKYKSGYLKNKILTNYSIWAIYPKKEGTWKGINNEILEEIKKLQSIEQIRFLENKIGTKIGPSKLGYSRVGFIRLNNKNLESFNKDYNYLKKYYKDLLVIE